MVLFFFHMDLGKDVSLWSAKIGGGAAQKGRGVLSSSASVGTVEYSWVDMVCREWRQTRVESRQVCMKNTPQVHLFDQFIPDAFIH